MDCPPRAPAGAAAGSRSARGSGSRGAWPFPTQSVPVSPPPMTTTSLPRAWIGPPSDAAVEHAPPCWRVRNSIAKWTPARPRPSTGRSRGCVAPVQMTVALNSLRKIWGSTFSPTLALQMNLTPSCSMSRIRRSTTSFLSSFMFGMPYMSSPPGRSARSKTVTVCPARLSCAAAERPAGPEPMTATFLPVRTRGASGNTQPSAHPWSMIAHSMFLIVTGVLLIPRTHEPSHGAGQTRPVNSGKLLVRCRRSSASRQRPAVDQVVPLGDQVVDRAARRHPADQLARCGRRGRRSPCTARPAGGACPPPCDGETPSSRRRAGAAACPRAAPAGIREIRLVCPSC